MVTALWPKEERNDLNNICDHSQNMLYCGKHSCYTQSACTNQQLNMRICKTNERLDITCVTLVSLVENGILVRSSRCLRSHFS